MKPLRFFTTAAATLACTVISALALTIPVAEDTFSNTSGTKLTAAAGKAPTLIVTPQQGAYFRFDLSNLPAALTADNLLSARLRLYIVKARVPDGLLIADVTSEWHETDNGPVPTVGNSAIGSISGTDVAGRKFVSVDVTASIASILNGAPNYGFVVAADGNKIVLGSKEGPAAGYPAYLDIEANYAFSSGNTALAGGLAVDGLGANNGNFANGQFLTFGAADGSTGEGIGSNRTGSNNQFGLDLFTNSTARLSITNNGSIGIGTTAPDDSILDVEGDIHINDYDIFLRTGGDRNHGLGYYGFGKTLNGLAVDGPVLYGYSGGALATNQNGSIAVALYWDRDTVRIGPNLNLYATVGPENLRIVRGNINADGTVFNGAGYTVARSQGAPQGDYTISFSEGFAQVPTVTATPVTSDPAATCSLFIIDNGYVRIRTYNSADQLKDYAVSFTAIGAR